jgi:hypothetical protein
MLNETTYRSLSFQEGTEVRLADGNVWTLPAAAPLLEQDGTSNEADESLSGLLDGVLEAEDRSEQLRAELALAIHLLGRNYRIGPRQYQAILAFAAGSPLLGASQEAFHAVALDYASRFRRHPGRSPESTLPSGWWTALTAAVRRLSPPRLLRAVRTRLTATAGVASR